MIEGTQQITNLEPNTYCADFAGISVSELKSFTNTPDIVRPLFLSRILIIIAQCGQQALYSLPSANSIRPTVRGFIDLEHMEHCGFPDIAVVIIVKTTITPIISHSFRIFFPLKVMLLYKLNLSLSLNY
jgi:hypothetical protein